MLAFSLTLIPTLSLGKGEGESSSLEEAGWVTLSPTWGEGRVRG